MVFISDKLNSNIEGNNNRIFELIKANPEIGILLDLANQNQKSGSIGNQGQNPNAVKQISNMFKNIFCKFKIFYF